MRPVTVQVVTYAPTAFYHCQHCEIAFGEMGLGERLRRDQAASSLPPDLALEFSRLSDWIRALVERHGPSVHVRVIDAASLEGFAASLRHRLRRYPAVIVDGERRSGEDLDAVVPLIDARVASVTGGR